MQQAFQFLVAVLFILAGLGVLLAPNLVWELTLISREMRGLSERASQRTPAWIMKTRIQGVALLVLGIAFLIL